MTATDLDIAPPFDMPQWLPRLIRGYIMTRTRLDLSREDWAILRRLACDPRMQSQWRFLFCKNKDGSYALPAKRLPGESQEDAQQRAAAEIFEIAFAAAASRARTWRRDEVDAARASLLVNAEDYRARADQDEGDAWELNAIAVAVRESGDKVSASRLFKIVNRRLTSAAIAREQANRLFAVEWEMPRDDDPLIVERYRSEHHIQGVQTILSAAMVELFGTPCDGMCAAIAAVALGRDASGGGAHKGDATRSVSRRRRRAQGL